MAHNPWKAESIQNFYFLICPECNFNTKEDNSFENHHATVNHPLSFVLFDKKSINEDFDTIDIKEEPLFLYDTQISHDDEKSSKHNLISPLSSSNEDNCRLVVPELKIEPTVESYMDQNESSDINKSEIENCSTNVAITGNNLVNEDPLNSDMISVHEEKMQCKSVYKEIKAFKVQHL